MFRKIFFVCLLMIFVLAPLAFADTARQGSFASGLQGVMGIGDVSSGIAAEVTDAGSVNVSDRAVAIGDAISATGNGTATLVYTGACRVLGIYVTGESAGDWAAVYDNTSATVATLKFDPRIAATTSSEYFDAKGAPFETGIYVSPYDGQVLATVVYDY